MRATASDARREALALLDQRGRGKTICPSEVARLLADGGPDWRDAMPLVHAAVDALVDEGAIRLSWKGQSLEHRDGPYRIRAARD